MGSTCSKNSKRTKYEQDFYELYGNFAVPEGEKQQPKNDQKLINGLKTQLSQSSFENNSELRQIRFAEKKTSVDWNSLEKSIQSMNLDLLREDLNNNPHQFLVNQILMSVQFFKNFER